MPKLEKRNNARQALQIPLRFRSLELDASDPEVPAETSNISRTGLFMRTPRPLKVGTPLSLTLRVPTYLSGDARSDINCMGRVIHERRLPNGDIGYGVQFEQILSFKQSTISSPVTSPT
jgi:hypothetical protein